MPGDRRQKRDLHALDADGMVVCNPRDKESAHRAQMEGIATDDLQNGGSLALSILSPAACFFTMACTGACCAW